MNDIKQYLDDAIKTLVTKDDILKLKDFIEEQSSLIKDLTSKITTLEDKVNSSEASVSKLNTKIGSLGKISLPWIAARIKNKKLDDLEQYGRREYLRFSGFEVKEKETKEECESMIKKYIKDTLKTDIGENDYNKTHRVCPKITNKFGQVLQQIIATFKGFSPRSSIYRAKKRKSNISVQLDLTKRRYLLLKDAYHKVKDNNRIDFVRADINCSLCLRLKNGKRKFFNSSEELEQLLLDLEWLYF